MKKILISNNKLLQPLYSNLDETVYEKKVMSELKCIDEIKKNNFDLALISPLVYTSVITKGDFRIVPTNMLIMEDYTNSLVINIKQNKESLEKIYFEEINEFMIVAAKLVLSERFNITPVLTNKLDEADIIVSNKKISDTCFDIDLTEDWYDTFEIPMVAGFWIVNNENEENVANAVKLTKEFAGLLHDHEHISDDYDDCYIRTGKKYWCWSEDVRQYLEKIFDILYYHGYSEHIADVKILHETYTSFNEENNENN